MKAPNSSELGFDALQINIEFEVAARSITTIFVEVPCPMPWKP